MTDQFDSIFTALEKRPRLLMQAALRPIQTDRFQPTGFPNLGPAEYKRLNADGESTPMLLVESAQSMANRMEKVCWDDATNSVQPVLTGLPYVEVDLGNGEKTTSMHEAHRLNSPRITDEQKAFKARLKEEIGDPPSDILRLPQVALRYDVGSVLHGVFLESIAGRLRLPRLVSSFIEAVIMDRAISGGAKFDTSPKKNQEEGKTSKEGYGNIIYSRTEYTAKEITAYFNFDLATMRGYRLGEAKNRLLMALALYKIFRLLDGNLRLRTACDFDAVSVAVTRPDDLDLSNRAELLAEIERKMPELIRACGFGDDPVTRLVAPSKGSKTTNKDEHKNAEQSVTNNDAPEEETPTSDDDEDEDA